MTARPSIDRTAADRAPDLAAALAEAPFLPSRKVEGWTALKQRQFLELIAVGQTVEAAAYMVQLSPQSAYAFRASARGAVFALGWRAALLLARDKLADTLLARAFDGQTVTITRADGSQVERHFHDNRLAMATLTRLDRLADNDAGGSGAGAPVSGGVQAARLAAQEWDGFLDLVGEERGPARAALFLARRLDGVGEGTAAALEPVAALARADLRLRSNAGHPDEVSAADLDPDRRADWTAGQWARAEAPGLVRLAPPPAPPVSPAPAALDGMSQPSQHSPAEDAPPVWWCEEAEAWRTRFPPPDDFDGEEEGEYGIEDYERTLSDAEEAAQEAAFRAETAQRRLVETAERDRWFAAAVEEAVVMATLAADLRDAAAPAPASAGADAGTATHARAT